MVDINDIFLNKTYITRFPYQPYLCRVSGGSGESDAVRGGEHEEVGHHGPGSGCDPLHCPSHRLPGSRGDGQHYKAGIKSVINIQLSPKYNCYLNQARADGPTSQSSLRLYFLQFCRKYIGGVPSSEAD